MAQRTRYPVRGGGSWFVLVPLIVLACADTMPVQPSRNVERPAAVVGGVAISTGDVRAEMEAAGGSAEEALERVIRRELLLRYARENDVVPNVHVRGAERRAIVREFLARKIEAEITAADIRDDDVRRAFESQAERFHQPERRTAIHFLAELSEESSPVEVQAAHDLASSVLAETRIALDPVAVFRARSEGVAGTRVEELGTFDRSANFVEAFRAPLFATEGPGLLPEVVRTQFGYHVVWIIRILPADDMPFELAAPILHRELLVARRAEALASLEAELVDRTEVVIDEALLRSLPDDFEKGER